MLAVLVKRALPQILRSNFPGNPGQSPGGEAKCLLLLVGAIVVMMGLVVFWIESLRVPGVQERLTPNIVYRVGTKLSLPQASNF